MLTLIRVSNPKLRYFFPHFGLLKLFSDYLLVVFFNGTHTYLMILAYIYNQKLIFKRMTQDIASNVIKNKFRGKIQSTGICYNPYFDGYLFQNLFCSKTGINF